MSAAALPEAWFRTFAARLERIHAERPDLVALSTGRGVVSVLHEAMKETIREESVKHESVRSRWRIMREEYAHLVPAFMYEARPRRSTPKADEPEPLTTERVIEALGRGQLASSELAERLRAPVADVVAMIEEAQALGFAIHLAGGKWRLDRAPQPAFIGREPLVHYADADGWHRFGAISDNHMGSKYSRLDVAEALYDAFAEAGVTRVYNAGNWIDGEANFNRHDLLAHGMDAQCRYLAQHYPRRDGITTYAVSGDDHEGWYAQREGVDIGRYAERVMREAGRADWIDLGYMEAPVVLRRRDSDKESILAVVHPGGGSSYALSYSIQKIIESLDGGEKPAIGLYGHYHKLWSGNIRNVWCVQTGCTQDQTPFMRKKKLEAHVGGAIIEAYQCPQTGAILRMKTELIRFFNKGFATDRWSHAAPVVQGLRGP